MTTENPESRRSALQSAVTQAQGEWEDLRDEVQDNPQKWPAAITAEEKLKVALAELDAFDAAHPELTAAQKAEERKRIDAAIDSAFNS